MRQPIGAPCPADVRFQAFSSLILAALSREGLMRRRRVTPITLPRTHLQRHTSRSVKLAKLCLMAHESDVDSGTYLLPGGVDPMVEDYVPHKRDWQEIAAEASVEKDHKKLQGLAEELAKALEERDELGKRRLEAFASATPAEFSLPRPLTGRLTE